MRHWPGSGGREQVEPMGREGPLVHGLCHRSTQPRSQRRSGEGRDFLIPQYSIVAQKEEKDPPSSTHTRPPTLTPVFRCLPLYCCYSSSQKINAFNQDITALVQAQETVEVLETRLFTKLRNEFFNWNTEIEKHFKIGECLVEFGLL